LSARNFCLLTVTFAIATCSLPAIADFRLTGSGGNECIPGVIYKAKDLPSQEISRIVSGQPRKLSPRPLIGLPCTEEDPLRIGINGIGLELPLLKAKSSRNNSYYSSGETSVRIIHLGTIFSKPDAAECCECTWNRVRVIVKHKKDQMTFNGVEDLSC